MKLCLNNKRTGISCMNEREYNKCVEEFADKVFKFFVKNLQETFSAEDLTQDVLTALWKNHTQVDFSKAKAYMFVSAHNLMVNFWDKERKSLEIKNNLSANKGIYTETTFENRDLTDRMLENLEESTKECLILRDLHGFSYKEIAEITDTTQANVKTKIFRARIKLKELIKDGKI